MGLSYYPREERYQPYRYTAAKPSEMQPTAAGQTSTQPFQHRTPCRDPQGEGESDLCAQWKAANAAEDSAFWAKWGFWIACIGSAFLLWQIMLTRKAVEDTSEATDAMRESNRIAEDSQRAWVTVQANPQAVQRYSFDGLYVQIDFVAENIGGTAAINFDFGAKVFFLGQSEKASSLDDKIFRHIEKFRDQYGDMHSAILAPRDKQTSSIWTSFKAEEVKWWKVPGGAEANPVLVAVVLYETPGKPGVVQCSWRSWYLGHVQADGRKKTGVPHPPMGSGFGPEALCVEPFRHSLMHTEHRDEDSPQSERSAT